MTERWPLKYPRWVFFAMIVFFAAVWAGVGWIVFALAPRIPGHEWSLSYKDALIGSVIGTLAVLGAYVCWAGLCMAVWGENQKGGKANGKEKGS